ncbi:hypothetical protein I876_07395 [Alteromonas mediterranea U7]|uniref:Uncharacterized protein n=2 Tax=Alteromonas mediterranea TaxID=314275 RepID=S5AG00_9ALTE|nr:hypothetical protein MADE_1007800 [Alteromonas mediterranea DE]AGP77676.1 hypothetical protein I633_07960 [Alteromonas mediterranea 615]AGP85220.1 hypothetical protein I607_07100 [Alteromonas mediterranea U4]AGP89351.1 hypothetical protein I876_07395 [Alteromonas mediterranea U7]AGP93223.1 hypothetical protein I634_07515 [Alteromonas mediterranea U8]
MLPYYLLYLKGETALRDLRNDATPSRFNHALEAMRH